MDEEGDISKYRIKKINAGAKTPTDRRISSEKKVQWKN